MNAPYTAPQRVPGLLGDDALQEQLKLFTQEQNAGAKAAPPPSSAVAFADRVQSEYLSKPLAGLAAATPAAGPAGPLLSALRSTTSMQPPQADPRMVAQTEAIDVRSDILSSMLRGGNELAGGALFPLAEGGLLANAGLLSPEQRQAEADAQAVDAKQRQIAIQNKAAVREQLRGLSPEDAAGLGALAPPGGVDASAVRREAELDAARVEQAAKNVETKNAALTDPSKQPTQAWWLSSLQGGVREMVKVPTSAAKGGLAAWELTAGRLLNGGDIERSDTRAWVQTVESTLDKMLPGDKTRSREFVDQLGQGAGSMVGYLLTGYVVGAIGLPGGLVGVGAAAGGGQQYEDAERHNGVGLQKYLAFVLGAGIRATDAIPVNRMFMRAEKATGGLVSRMLSNTTAGSLEEFIQEFGQAVGTDTVARWVYDENREFDIGAYAKQGLVGAIVGGATGALTTARPPKAAASGSGEATGDQTSLVEQVMAGLQTEFDSITDNAEQLLGKVEAPDIAATVKGPGGSVPVNANGMFEAYHLSSQARAEIDPAFRGTGPLRGVERQRLSGGGDVVDRAYYGVGDPNFAANFRENLKTQKPKDRGFMQDTDPYHREGLGPYRHTVEVDPGTIYNMLEDPLDLRAKLDPELSSPERVTQMERMVRDAGFAGVYMARSSLGQTAYLFGKQTPKSVIDERYGLPASEVAAPADFANATPETFRKGGWGVVTALQEARGDVFSPPNLEANEKLRKELKRSGYKFEEIEGAYKGTPQGSSFLVFAPEAFIKKLGEKYRQESVLTRRGLEYTDGSNRLVPAVPSETVVGDAARAMDFYSTLPGDGAFSMGLDFDRMGDADAIAEDEFLAKREQALTEPERIAKLTEQFPGVKGILKYATPEEQARITTRTAEKLVNIFEGLPSSQEMAAVAFSGRAKRGWYARSARALVDIFGVEDAPRFAALLAALSPQVSVESNTVNALKVWTAWVKAGRPLAPGRIKMIMGLNVQGDKGENSVLEAWVNNSIEALTNPDPAKIDLSGPKVTAFMNNLRGNVTAVTNDAWMANYANVDQTLFKGQGGKVDGRTIARPAAGYIAMSAAVRKAAEVATEMTGETWTPAEIQETVWSWAKTLYEKADAEGVSAEQIIEAARMTAEEISATPDFATLFTGGVFRNILEQGGYDLKQLDEGVAGAGGSVADGSHPASAEGTAFDSRAFDGHLRDAARRLDALRQRRAEEKGGTQGRAEVADLEVDAEGVGRYGLPEDADDLLAMRGAAQTETEAFKKWFGDSKVVDESGAPLVVYHGTQAGDFDQFLPGAYFTTDPSEASAYTFAANMRRRERASGKYATATGAAEFAGKSLPYFGTTSDIDNPVDGQVYATDLGVLRKRKGGWDIFTDLVVEYGDSFDGKNIRVVEGDFAADAQQQVDDYEGYINQVYPGGDGGRVYPVYLSIKNPVELPYFEGNRLGERLGATRAEIEQKIAAWKEQGYDGIVTESDDTAHWVDGTPRPAQYVAFDPTQIKSVNNRGAFDPNDPNILAMPGGTAANRSAYKGEQRRPDTGIAQPQGQPQQPVNPVEAGLSAISRNFIKALDLTARQGRFTLKGSDIMGQYSKRTDVVRLRTWNDLSTLVHEGGHAVERQAGPALRKFVDARQAQFMKVGDDLYGIANTAKLNKENHTAEGFAELFRVYTLNRRFAEQKYPQLTQELDDFLRTNEPELRTQLGLIGDQFKAWLQLPSADIVRGMVVSGAQDAGFGASLRELKEAGFQTWMQEVVRNRVTESVNRYAGVNTLVNRLLNLGEENQKKAIDLKAADDPRVLIRLSANTGARAMVQTTDGVMDYNSVNVASRGLREALLRYHGLDADRTLDAIDPQRQQDFAAYLVALRGLDEYRRYADGKIARPPLAASEGDLAQAVTDLDAQYGQDFRAAAEIAHEYGMALWKKSYDAGLLSKDTYKEGLERQFYVPLQRDLSDKRGDLGNSPLTSGGGRNATSIVKRFKGSDRNVIDPMDVLMHKTFALEKIIAENEVKRTLARLADRAGTAGSLVERIPASQLIGQQHTVEDVARQLTNDPSITAADAADLMTILEASIEDGNVLRFYQSKQAGTAGENVVFFWENGKLAAIQLMDGDIGKDVVNVLNGLGRETVPWWAELIAETSSVFRSAITLWPDFLIVNFIRDQMSTFILNNVGFKPFVTGLKGVGEELRQGDWARQYNASMAIMGGMSVGSLHKARVDREIGALRSKGYRARTFGDGWARGMARVAELTETGTRMGLYKLAFERAKKDGLNDWEAAVEAGYIATDTMDFSLNGGPRSALARRTVPFLNAQVQGLYKMMRTLGADEVRQRKGLMFAVSAYFKSTKNLDLSRREKLAIQTGRKAWIKMSALGVISAALHFLFEDDPDYQEAGEYLRTTGWVIPIGDGRIFYVPKPFELAVLANLTERAIEYGSGDPEAKNRLLRGMAMTLTPPTAPPAVQLGVELAANHDFFSGREIVPDYMQSLAGELQYNNYTSSIARGIAEVTGWSAMKVDHVLAGLGASAYRDVSNTVNAIDPKRPAMDTVDTPIVRRFVRDARRGSTTSQDFWRYASTTTGLLTRAEKTYRAYLESGNVREADAYLNGLDDDTKAFALLNAHFKADAKRLNPFYRNRQIATVVSAMRREMGSDLGLENTDKYGDPITLTRREKRDADRLLSELVRRETRNTLVYSKTPGWAGRKPLDVETTLDMIGAVDPRVREELERRLNKVKVYSAESVQEYWPEVKDRLLVDRENTFLKDLVTAAGAAR